eukprot:scaffold363_cov56-Cylindrotheca_fusiformis.AAC.6
MMHTPPQQLDRRRQSMDEETASPEELLPSPPKKKARFILSGDDPDIYLPELPEGPLWDSDLRPVVLKMRTQRLPPMKKSATSASFLVTEPISLASLFLAVSNS